MPSPALAGTRDSWHRVAEHVLAAGQFAAAGTVRLRVSAGGFSTVADVDGRQLAVVGLTLVVTDGERRRSAPFTSIGDLASFAGLEPGLRGSYSPATPSDPDAPLPGDEESARLLAEWFALGDDALRRLSSEVGDARQPVLWPEHLDVGITLGAVNYGCSPGDDVVPEPYLYVGPHGGPPDDDPFWNAPFGAAATAGRIAGADDAVAFLRQGRARTERMRQEPLS